MENKTMDQSCPKNPKSDQHPISSHSNTVESFIFKVSVDHDNIGNDHQPKRLQLLRKLSLSVTKKQ